MKMSSGSGAVSCSAAPTACAIRPQFGSPPCSAALTSGELAIARATLVDDVVVAAAHDDAADPLGALAVAHDVQRELAQRPVQRLAEARPRPRSAARPPRRSRPRPAGSRCRWWRAARRRRPGRTSARRTRRAAGRRSRRSSAASVWTKQSIVANAGEIIPAPLACAVSRTVPDGSATSTSTSLANLSVVRIASEKSPWPYSRSSRARARDAADRLAGVQRHADHAGGGDRDLVLAHAAGHRRGALHRARRPRSPRLPVAALALPELATITRSASSRVRVLGEHDRRRQHAGAGEARRATRSPAPSRPSGPGPSRRDGFKPHATPAARNPPGRSPGFSVTCAGISSQRELKADPPSRDGRTSGSGSARPATPRPSTGCRSPRRR